MQNQVTSAESTGALSCSDPRTEKSQLTEENPGHRPKRQEEGWTSRLDSSNRASTKTAALPYRKHLSYTLQIRIQVQDLQQMLCVHTYTCTQLVLHLYLVIYIFMYTLISVNMHIFISSDVCAA